MSNYFIVEVEPDNQDVLVEGIKPREHNSDLDARIELDFLNMTSSRNYRIVTSSVLSSMKT